MLKIILASKSKVRHDILKNNRINCVVEPSNVDEDPIKESLLHKGATPELVSKNLAEIKANKVSQKKKGELVLGADSVIDLDGEIISKPVNRIKRKNSKKIEWKVHYLISSACISKNGSMIWNFTDKASLTMKKMTEEDLKNYLAKVTDENLFAYNVYQIEERVDYYFQK